MKWRLLAVACVLLALGLLLYPLMGELVSEKYHSDVETVYTNAIEDADDAELANQRRTAEAYNALLRGEAAVSTGGASASPLVYAEQLTVGGAMCTIDIPKIGVYLPVRHGTGAETLERTVGHVVGTSLPVGRQQVLFQQEKEADQEDCKGAAGQGLVPRDRVLHAEEASAL